MITESDGSASVFLLSPAPGAVAFSLETPAGDVIDPAAAAALPAIEFVAGQRVHQYRMSLPVPVGAGAGQGLWHALLAMPSSIPRTHRFGERQSRASSAAVHGLLYSLNVHATSTLRMGVSVAQSSHEPGGVLTLRAFLAQSGLPLEKRAFVRAEVRRPDGSAATLQLPEVEPGVFETHTTAPAPGIYPIRFRAVGRTLRGHRFSREQLRTAAVWRGGDGQPPTGTTHPPSVDWCALLSCLLRQDGILDWLKRQGVDVEQLRRCLTVACRGREGRRESPTIEAGLLERLLPALEKAIRSR